MPELNIEATFNGNPGVSFVQGEDRAIAVSLRDAETGIPIDLTQSAVRFEFVGSDGQPITRRSDALTLTQTCVAAGGVFTCAEHGLVSVDPVTFVGAGMPAPLSALTTYLVDVIDENTFSVTDASGNPIVITAAPTAQFALHGSDVVFMPPPTSGLVTLLLREPVTAAIQVGEAQTFQVELVNQGLLRIVLEPHELDVYPQVVQ